MDKPIKVALIRTDRRRGGVAQALDLIADDIRRQALVDPHPVIIPNLDNPVRAWTCTHRDTLSAAVDSVLAAGANAITLAVPPGPAGSPEATAARLGYSTELWGQPVKLPQPDAETGSLAWPQFQFQEEGSTSPIDPLAIHLPSWVAASRFRIVLGAAKTHQTFRVGLGLTSLKNLVHPTDRGWFGATGAGSPVGDGPLAGALESCRGLLVRAWLVMRSNSGGMRLTRAEQQHLAKVEHATRALVALATFLRPHISLVDGFEPIEGQGPRHGRKVPLGTIVAGTDPVAVDAVSAAMLGFDPMEIGYLRLAHRLGLGAADLDRITLVGDPLTPPRRRLRTHSSDRFLRLARTSPDGSLFALPRPHFGTIPPRTPAASGLQYQGQRDANRL